MIAHFGANTVHRTVILWILAFLIGPWPALSCIIHCFHLPRVHAAGIEHFLCNVPHPSTQHETNTPPVRYDLLPFALITVIGMYIVIRRMTTRITIPLSSFIVPPDPPPPRKTCFWVAG